MPLDNVYLAYTKWIDEQEQCLYKGLSTSYNCISLRATVYNLLSFFHSSLLDGRIHGVTGQVGFCLVLFAQSLRLNRPLVRGVY